MSNSIVVSGLSFAWPDGASVFTSLDAAVSTGRTGLIGANGTGKSTLLKLIAGQLKPQHGTVFVNGTLGYLRQDVTLDASMPVDAVLGIANARRGLAASERGEAGPENFAAVGDDWDPDGRARAVLDHLGLSHVDIDRQVGHVSGGEAMLLALAGLFLRRPEVILLDEPTNNLDLNARKRLYEAVSGWPGVMLIVSHDRVLLEQVDQIADLREGEIRWYGGNIDGYEAAVEAEQEAAQRMVRVAEADVKRQKRELIEAQTKLDRRRKQGEKLAASGSIPRIVAGARKRAAQVSAGKHKNMHQERLAAAKEKLNAAEDAVYDDDVIRVDLPHTAVPSGRVMLERDFQLRNGIELRLDVRGPERIALLGPNGSGKTTLLEAIAAHPKVPSRYLPQRLDILDPQLSIVDNVKSAASANTVRAMLARFLFRGTKADQLVATLSGGERFRAALASLLLADPAPQLLLLDEPTNNLDLASVKQLAQALNAYQGALIIATHDLPFIELIGITRTLALPQTMLNKHGHR